MAPYHEHRGITIYHGRCEEVLPEVAALIGLVLSDPPYGSGLAVDYADRFSPRSR